MGGGVHSAGNHAVGLILVNHHGAEVGVVGHLLAGLLDGHALLGAQFGVGGGEVFVVGGGGGLDDLGFVHVHAEFGGAGLDLAFVAEEDDLGHLALDEDGGGVDEAVFLAFGKHDAHHVLLGLFDKAEFEEAGGDVAFAGVEDAGEIGGLAAHGEGEVGVDGGFVFSGHAGEEHAEQFHGLFLHLALPGHHGGDDFGGAAAFAVDHQHDGSAHVGGEAAVEGAFESGALALEVGTFDEHEIRLGGGFLVGGEHGVDEFVALAGVDEVAGGAEAGDGAEEHGGFGLALDEIHHSGNGFGLAGVGCKSGHEKSTSHGKNSLEEVSAETEKLN